MKISVSIQQLTLEDLEHVGVLQPDGWGDILTSIRFYCTSGFCHPLKATIDDKLVGIGTAIIHGTTAWLAHIIVHKDHRKAGIGTTITKSLIDLVHKTSCQTMLLIATTLGEPVYRKLGFSVETRYLFLDNGTLPEPAGESNIIPFQQQYQDTLMQFDHRISGEYREGLFSAHLTDSKLFLDGGEITGFYIPSLGEGLIIASDPHAGIELMKYRWKLNKMFCIPVNNEFGISFLKQHGYETLREASRMILGKKIVWDASHIYSRIGGNLG
jgi:GNAT superfamily N-acetyltransferase